ncbi:uncharacterized protein LOC120347637 [Styela clava]
MNSELVACLCLMIATTGYAIRCYVCSHCNDKKLTTFLMVVDCRDEFLTCAKETENGTVSLFCSKHNETGCKQRLAGDVMREVCICKEDKCNRMDTASTTATETTSSAGSIKSSFIVGSVISLLVAIAVL